MNATVPIIWQLRTMGEGALLLDAEVPSESANRYVLALADHLTTLALPGIVASVPAICSLLIIFDPLQLSRAELEAHLTPMLAQITPAPAQPARVLRIAVRYGGADGPDLEAVAAQLGLRPAEVIALHCGQVYRVMMLGFAPGFPYLGPLPPALDVPRRSTPRTAVPAGSVAIAAGLTGIYPTQLPGGWHLIGRTAQHLFDPTHEPPALLAPGDGVQFEPLVT